MTNPLARRLAEQIGRDGPISFATFMDAALYDPEGGFYSSGGRAGPRRGDFLTSPEVGPLFGAVVAGALDTWWSEMGSPEPFTVVEVGAGVGTLARAVVAAAPACAPVLRYVAVERSGTLRAEHPAGVESMAALPDESFVGVVLANELLDNLAFRLLVQDGRWWEAHVGVEADRFVEVLLPVDPPAFVPPASSVGHGARVAWQDEAAGWLAGALARVERGRVVVLDYTTTTAVMAARPWRDWLRTYRGHERGGHYLATPGSQDITAEVALDQLAVLVRPPDAVRTQAQWLALHGMDELVEEGRRVWAEQAARPGLEAMRARSRVVEADALRDPGGLGAFTVAEWQATADS